jgi:hypothetical protein
LTYKDLEKNKVASRKLVDFAAPEVYEVLSKAQKDEEYDVELVKNESSGYWDWVGASEAGDEKPVDESGDVQPAPAKAATKGSPSTYGRDFETRKERDRRQAAITRSVALAQAVAFCIAAKADGLTVKEVTNTAKKFENYLWVGLGDDTPMAIGDVVEGIAMMPNDVPE